MNGSPRYYLSAIVHLNDLITHVHRILEMKLFHIDDVSDFATGFISCNYVLSRFPMAISRYLPNQSCTPNQIDLGIMLAQHFGLSIATDPSAGTSDDPYFWCLIDRHGRSKIISEIPSFGAQSGLHLDLYKMGGWVCGP